MEPGMIFGHLVYTVPGLLWILSCTVICDMSDPEFKLTMPNDANLFCRGVRNKARHGIFLHLVSLCLPFCIGYNCYQSSQYATFLSWICISMSKIVQPKYLRVPVASELICFPLKCRQGGLLRQKCYDPGRPFWLSTPDHWLQAIDYWLLTALMGSCLSCWVPLCT